MTMLSELDIPAAPRLNRRQQAKRRTRQKVLDSARALFCEKGFDLATIRDIAKGAGMSTGAVFANFDSKEELCLAVIEEDLEVRMEKLRAAAETTGDVWEVVGAISSADYAHQLEQLSFTPLLFETRWTALSQRSISECLRNDRTAVNQLLHTVLRNGIGHPGICETQAALLTAETLWAVHMDNYRLAMLDDFTIEQLDKRFKNQAHKILSPS